jgi:hypothetical protein
MRKLTAILFLYTLSLAQEVGARYLIITHDNFYSAVQPLAQWKHRKGLKTKVVKLSQIGNLSSQIKSYIQNAYNTWPITPEYVLFVGANNYLPFPYTSGVVSDNYYTNMDGDIYNEILSGRLTVHDTIEAQTVVNKILLYEKNPDITDSLWLVNACLIVREDYNYYDDSIYWNNINHVKNLMYDNGYSVIDTFSRSAGDNSYDVLDAVNEGRAFVLYRGSATNNWYYPFDVNPSQTQNSTKLPIVLSITCGTIGTGSTPAAAERWLLTGMPASPRGAAGYFATTTSGINISHLRSAVCKGFFNGLFQQGRRIFGEACEAGRMNVYNLYYSSSEYRGFTTLGDPSMNIWTAVPKPLEVFHDSILPMGQEWLTVSVKFEGAPVESALVCVVLDTLIYEYGYTTNEGEITFNLETLEPGYMQVTVTAQNKIPYMDSIPVISTHIEEGARPTTNTHNLVVNPNPFTHSTQIRYSILDSRYLIENPTITIYNAAGRLVKFFNLGSSIQDQESSVIWSGVDDMGNKLPVGVYFVEIRTSEKQHTIPILLVR